MTLPEARVALLTNFIPPYRVPVLRALAARVGRLRVLISTPMEAGRDWAPEWEGLDVAVQRGFSRQRVWRHPSGFRERIGIHYPLDTLPRLMRFGPDVVISGEFGMRSLQAALWCLAAGTPLVIWATLSERTEAGRGRLRQALRRWILDRAVAVIVNGESGARYIRSFGYPDERIHRVRQASPAGRSAAAGGRHGQQDVSAQAPLRLLYVGRLVELKGLRPTIRRLSDWCDSRARPLDLRLVGSGPAEEAIRSEPRSELLTMALPGAVPFEALDAEYAAADLLLFPTLADEWGLVVNEAMAAGLPVLGSVHSQAVLELVEPDRTGWRYDPERPGELEQVLDGIVAAGREGIRRMGTVARTRVAELTPEAMGHRIATLIGGVLAGGAKRT